MQCSVEQCWNLLISIGINLLKMNYRTLKKRTSCHRDTPSWILHQFLWWQCLIMSCHDPILKHEKKTSHDSHGIVRVYIPGDYSSHVFFCSSPGFRPPAAGKGPMKKSLTYQRYEEIILRCWSSKDIPNLIFNFDGFYMFSLCFLVYITSQGDEDQECTDPAIPHQDLVQSSGFSAKTLCTFLP